MTQQEKDILTEIVSELEKVTRATLHLQKEMDVRLQPQLKQSFDTLRRQIGALPSR
jgi:hypothetical protein